MDFTSMFIFTLPIIAPGSCRPPGKTEDQLVRLMNCNAAEDCILN